MHRHPGARVQEEPQRRVGLHPIEAEGLVAGESGDVAGLADLVDQAAKHRVARAVLHGVEQRGLGESAQPRPVP